MGTDLLKRLKDGDELAYKFIFDTYYPALTNFAYKFFKDVELSKDVVQNMFIKIYQNRHNLTIETNLKTYLFKAVHNASLNELKKETVRELYHAQYNAFQENTYYEQALEQKKRLWYFCWLQSIYIGRLP